MAWNPSPMVKAARDFGQKFGCDTVIVFFKQPDGQYGYVSYGETMGLCAKAQRIGDSMFETFENEIKQ